MVKTVDPNRTLPGETTAQVQGSSQESLKKAVKKREHAVYGWRVATRACTERLIRSTHIWSTVGKLQTKDQATYRQ